MRKNLLFLILLLFSCRAMAQKQDFSNYGDLLWLTSPHAPFPAESRKNGHEYNTKKYSAEKHYADSSVAVFVPKYFKHQSEVDVVVYFHGWYNHVDSVLQTFMLIEQLYQSGKNAILVIPQMPKDAPDSNGGKLETQNGLSNLLSDVLGQLNKRNDLKTSKLGNVVLAAHSGGYRTMSYILLRGGLEIKEVYLFDGLYAGMEKFAVWLLQTKGRMVNFYADDGGTKTASLDFIDCLNAWKIPYSNIEEMKITLAEMEKHRILFIHTTATHNDVVHLNNSFYKCLATSDIR